VNGRILLSIVTWCSMSLWMAAMVAAGVAAAGVFATLPDLNPTLPEFAALDPSLHGRLASGLVTEPIFTASDIAQVVLSCIVLLCILLHWTSGAGRHRPVARISWTVAGLLAAACLWARLLLVMPRMNSELQAYRSAARNGDTELATASYDAFNALHPTASTLMETSTVLAMVAIAALSILYALPRHKDPAS